GPKSALNSGRFRQGDIRSSSNGLGTLRQLPLAPLIWNFSSAADELKAEQPRVNTIAGINSPRILLFILRSYAYCLCQYLTEKSATAPSRVSCAPQQARRWVESRCDAVAVGRIYLFPPLSSTGGLQHRRDSRCRRGAGAIRRTRKPTSATRRSTSR